MIFGYGLSIIENKKEYYFGVSNTWDEALEKVKSFILPRNLFEYKYDYDKIYEGLCSNEIYKIGDLEVRVILLEEIDFIKPRRLYHRLGIHKETFKNYYKSEDAIPSTDAKRQ